MIDLIDSGKKIINVDQTPIGDSNFHTRGWMPINERQSKPLNIVAPRITMVAAVTSDGKQFFSLM